MYRLSNRGLGDSVVYLPDWWMELWMPKYTQIGVAPAPTGSVLTTPPASGAEAQATVDAALNAQLEAQKAENAKGIKSDWMWELSSGIVDTGNSVSDTLKSPFGLSWLVWGALGLGVFALVAVGGGSARRYGR